MKILHFTSCLLGGGIQNFLVSLLPEQVKLGHKVCLVVIEKYTDNYCITLESKLTERGVSVINLGKIRHNKISLFKTLFAAKEIVKNWKPDIINPHGAMCDYYAKIASWGTKAIQIDTVHNGPELWGIVNKTLNSKDPLIFCSQAAYELRVQKNQDIIAIDNGISREIIHSLDIVDLRKEFNLVQTDKVIVSVGSLRPQKNYTLLKEIVDKLNDSSYHFFVCGGNYGSGYVDIKEFDNYKDTIHFLGLRSDISQIENGADLFLSCASFEGLPIAVLEAFFNGIPCILSPIPQHQKIAAGVKQVYIPTSFNADDFVKTIKEAVKNIPTHEEIYDSRQNALSPYSISETAKKYISFYEKHLKNNV